MHLKNKNLTQLAHFKSCLSVRILNDSYKLLLIITIISSISANYNNLKELFWLLTSIL